MKINWGTSIILAFTVFIAFILFFVIRMSVDHRADHDLVTEEYSITETPFTAKISSSTGAKQREMWSTELINTAAQEALKLSRQRSPDGYRLMASFDPSNNYVCAGSNPSELFFMGGGQLGLYI